MQVNSHDCMSRAVQEAYAGLRSGDGGPFGAVIVRGGEIIAADHNRVLSSNDPTAHAEINVIRKAAARLGRYDLSDCELYTSCEPCPMCFAAVHWARIPKMFYGADRQDAASGGFDDEHLYRILRDERPDEELEVRQIDRELCVGPFREWDAMEDKSPY